MDNNRLARISKKYSSRSIKSWERPPAQIVSAVSKILQLNKTKSLQISSRKTANLIQQDIDLGEFIKLFLKQLKNTKLPGLQQNELDYDHDYQLKREKYITNLYSNELNQIEHLKETLKQESAKNKSITKFVNNYERLYREELKKLEDIDKVSTKYKKKNGDNLETLQLSTDNNSEDINEILKQLETQLDKIDDSTKQFQELSTQIDQLINQL